MAGSSTAQTHPRATHPTVLVGLVRFQDLELALPVELALRVRRHVQENPGTQRDAGDLLPLGDIVVSSFRVRKPRSPWHALLLFEI
jgi:hypothetical protein